MTRDRIDEAISKLRKLFIKDGARSEQCLDVVSTMRQKDHCIWMCDQVLRTDDQRMSDAEAMRWLCFVQGVAWSCCMGEFEGDES